MENKSTRKEILKSRRLVSIETQIFTYLGNEKMTSEKIQKAFYGIASLKTINTIVKDSPFFNVSEGMVEVHIVDHKADITYDFEPDAPGAVVFLSGNKGTNGKNQKLKSITLTGIGYRINVKVVNEAIGNWSLNISEIKVTDSGDIHKRKMEFNPLKGNKSHNNNYDTNQIIS